MMSIKLIDRNSACWRIFNLPFDIYVPQSAMYSTEYLKSSHVNISGDLELDHQRVNEMMLTKLTVAGLAMLVLEGYEFGMGRYEDCVQIFSDIQGHLNDWRDQTRVYTHPLDFPPIEELRALESIALSMYRHAMDLNPATQETSKIFDALVRMNRNRNIKSTNKWLKERVSEMEEYKPYISIVDDIERYIVENSNV